MNIFAQRAGMQFPPEQYPMQQPGQLPQPGQIQPGIGMLPQRTALPMPGQAMPGQMPGQIPRPIAPVQMPMQQPQNWNQPNAMQQPQMLNALRSRMRF